MWLLADEDTSLWLLSRRKETRRTRELAVFTVLEHMCLIHRLMRQKKNLDSHGRKAVASGNTVTSATPSHWLAAYPRAHTSVAGRLRRCTGRHQRQRHLGK